MIFTVCVHYIAIGPQEADSDDPEAHMEYLAQIYYLSQPDGRNKWTMKIIVTKNLESFISVSSIKIWGLTHM